MFSRRCEPLDIYSFSFISFPFLTATMSPKILLRQDFLFSVFRDSLDSLKVPCNQMNLVANVRVFVSEKDFP